MAGFHTEYLDRVRWVDRLIAEGGLSRAEAERRYARWQESAEIVRASFAARDRAWWSPRVRA